MNSYRAVRIAPDRWAVEWTADGVVQGMTYGTYESKVEAAFAVYELAVMELLEARDPPDARKARDDRHPRDG